jgi:hypothetical protein
MPDRRRDQCVPLPELVWVPGETGASFDCGTVLGLDEFKFGVVGATRPPVAPPIEFPPTPAPGGAALPPLCADAPVAMPNANAAPSATTPIFLFMISSRMQKRSYAEETSPGRWRSYGLKRKRRRVNL